MWINERLQIAAKKTRGFVLKDKSVLDEKEYILKIAVEILQPTIHMKNYKGVELLMFIF